MERQGRNVPPGTHSWRRQSRSDYSVRLREKQKVKRYYGVLERQFLRYFNRADRLRTNTGAALLSLLERRLDNVIFKLGFAPSRKAARQLICHGHVYVNGRKLDRASYEVRQGDRITPKNGDRSEKLFRENLEDAPSRMGGQMQAWLHVESTNLTGTISALPNRDDVQIPVEEQLIVELLSK
jgi:small subunit ribosomal protein S4